jgi:ABC-type antimicrobial peptide transport system permease subunit
MGVEPDLSPVDDFAKLKKTLQSVPNVKSVVPMGINGALVTSGNTIDVTLEKLRDAVKANASAPTEGRALPVQDSASRKAQVESLKALVRQMVSLLQQDLKKSKEISTSIFDKESEEALARVSSDEFWTSFDQNPLDSLEFLENKIAPLATDADLLFIRYIGTDLDSFQKSFDRMEIVDGTAVPEGKRGFLFSKFMYEETLKLKTARRLDKLKEAITEKGQKIAADPDLKRYVRENQSQTREILFQLDALKTAEMTKRLQKALGSQDTNLGTLLTTLLDTNDENFQQRYQIFYEQVAPMLDLYRIRIGDMLTIKSFTRSGYVQAVNVKVYGTFQFKGLEKSTLSGSLNLMDLMSFRELYGYLTSEKVDELKKLQAQVGAKQVSRESAEEELFGSGGSVVAEATPGLIEDAEKFDSTARALRTEDLVRRVYSREEIESGVVLNSAVILEDPKKLEQTLQAIEEAAKRDNLSIKVISWQKASGLLGQLVLVLKLALVTFVLIIFVVALVIINNAIMMATLQRTREIGTMRAIGAQRNFVLSMILTETLTLGAVFGAAGMLFAAATIGLLNRWGIPATSDQLYFFFSGPRLHPTLSAGNLLLGFFIVVVVSAVSTLYPAFLATRVSPIQAMASDE